MAMSSEDVIEMLKQYREEKKRLKLLKFEAQFLPEVSEDEVIRGMALQSALRDTGVSVRTSGGGDKTQNVAENYGAQTRRLNRECREGVERELVALTCKVDRIETYVSVLPREMRSTIEARYFRGMTWPEIHRETGKAERTLNVLHKRATEELARMFNMIEATISGHVDAEEPKSK